MTMMMIKLATSEWQVVSHVLSRYMLQMAAAVRVRHCKPGFNAAA